MNVQGFKNLLIIDGTKGTPRKHFHAPLPPPPPPIGNPESPHVH